MNSKQRSALEHIIRKTLKQQQKPQSPSEDSSKGTEEPNIAPPPVSTEPDPVPTAITTYDTKNDKQKWREKWKFRLECAGAFILLCYTGFAAWQACETKRSVDVVEKQFKLSGRPWINVDTGVRIHQGSRSYL
jgi:hypothetical protein